jgi:cell pole-organizing protein PopZ
MADSRPEPSMEDILASIKRIIADDNPLPRRHAATSPAGAAKPFESGRVAPPPELQRAPFGTTEHAKPHDDSVLELTTPAPILSPPPPPPHLQDRQQAWPPEDVPAVSRVVDRLRQSEAASAQARAASVAAAAAPPQPEPPIPAFEPRRPEPASWSPPPASVAAAAGITLDALVRDMLRPMLSEWIDTHMPAIVERLVKQEIEGISDDQT